MSATSRPAAGRARSRPQSWGVVLCMSLVSGLLFLPVTPASAATTSAELSISGSVSPDSVSGGGTLTYGFNVHNEGPDLATGTTLTSELPSGLTLASMSTSAGTCSASASTVTCSLGTLTPGPADINVSIAVVTDDVATDTLFDVHASVTATTPDPDDTNNDLTVTGSVLARVGAGADPTDLQLVSVVNLPNPVTGGYDLGSTATVTNLGLGISTGTTLTDTLAPGESFVAGGSDPSCTANAAVVTCGLAELATGDITTVLIITKTPQVAADTTIHDAFAVSAPQDSTPANDALDVVTSVRAPRADFVAGYVPASRSITWLNDATQWSHGDPVATVADPTVAFVGIPGGGPGGPVTVNEMACGAPFVCMTSRRSDGGSSRTPRGVFGNLVQVSVPVGYGASNPITGAFLDNWSIAGYGWDPFKVSYLSAGASAPAPLSWCGGWRHTGPPCVSWLERIYSWRNPYANGDLHTVVRFTNSGTFGRGR